MNKKAQEKDGGGTEGQIDSLDKLKKKKKFDKMKKRKEKFQKRRLEKQQERDKNVEKTDKEADSSNIQEKAKPKNKSKKTKKQQPTSISKTSKIDTPDGDVDTSKNKKTGKRASTESVTDGPINNVDEGPKPKLQKKQSLPEGARQAKKQVSKKDEQKFNKLVSSYKKKLLGADNAPKKTEGARWFE